MKRSASLSMMPKLNKRGDMTLKQDLLLLDIDDRVMVKIVVFDGKHNIADKWEEDSYQITSQPNVNIPVSTVEKEDGTGRKRTLHRNLLFLIGQTDEENSEQKTIP